MISFALLISLRTDTRDPKRTELYKIMEETRDVGPFATDYRDARNWKDASALLSNSTAATE